MQSESTFSAGRCEDLCTASQKRLIHFTSQFGACRSGISKIWKKCQNPDILRNLALFSDPLNSTCKVSKWARKVPPLFPPGRCIDLCESTYPSGRCEDLCTAARKRLTHFACQFGALRSGISKIWTQPSLILYKVVLIVGPISTHAVGWCSLKRAVRVRVK
jgi:hypothetical protein